MPGPTLLESELFEAVRVERAEAGRDDETDDEKEVSRRAPAIDVALTCALIGREAGGACEGPIVSPPRSTRVLRFRALDGGGIVVVRALVAAADISKRVPCERMLLGGRRPEVNCRCIVKVALPFRDWELTMFSLLWAIVGDSVLGAFRCTSVRSRLLLLLLLSPKHGSWFNIRHLQDDFRRCKQTQFGLARSGKVAASNTTVEYTSRLRSRQHPTSSMVRGIYQHVFAPFRAHV